MNEYMMIFRNEKAETMPTPTPEQMQTAITQWRDWIHGIAAKGYFAGTNRLLSEGKSIKAAVVSDGPYAEVKEVVGEEDIFPFQVGFLVLLAMHTLAKRWDRG